MSKDLLREAIADAKAVRETAIANARLALEEAFTPKLQSMLSAKIQEEDELEEDELDAEDTAPVEDETAVADDSTSGDVPDDSTEVGVQNDETEDTGSDEPAEETYEDSEEVEEDEELEEGEEEVAEEDEEEVTEDDAELEEIIKELEGEEEVTEGEEVEEEEDLEEDIELDTTKANGTDLTEDEDEVEENLDLDEVLRSLQEEDEEEVEENYELEEAYNTIRSLKATINEVNLLNAKLLFSNKLFRNNNLNVSQKMKVIETFDRANSVREVKLVYSTLSESLSAYTPSRKKRVTEGFASKTSKSTAPKKGVIVESNDFANRMKKLAGLL
jgi:hypothetical protein